MHHLSYALSEKQREWLYQPMVSRRRKGRIEFRKYVMAVAVFFLDGKCLLTRCQPGLCAERQALNEIDVLGLDISDIVSFRVIKLSTVDVSVYPGLSLPCSDCTTSLLKHNINFVWAVANKETPTTQELIDLNLHIPYERWSEH